MVTLNRSPSSASASIETMICSWESWTSMGRPVLIDLGDSRRVNSVECPLLVLFSSTYIAIVVFIMATLL